MKEKKRGGRLLPTLFIIVCAGVLLFSLYQIFVIQKGYADARNEYSRVREQYTVPAAETADAVAAEEEGLDFAALLAANPDFVGWIEVPGTALDYPVVRGSDNSYYLNHTFEKTYNSSGSIFMDYQSNSDFTSRNTVLYGHNMKDGSMFALVKQYLDSAFAAEHPEVLIHTAQGTYHYAVFAVRDTDINDGGYRTGFADEQDYMSYAQAMGAKLPGPAILTLSTCTNREDDERYVLQAELTQAPKGFEPA